MLVYYAANINAVISKVVVSACFSVPVLRRCTPAQIRKIGDDLVSDWTDLQLASDGVDKRLFEFDPEPYLDGPEKRLRLTLREVEVRHLPRLLWCT